jgi:hypothetical protein
VWRLIRFSVSYRMKPAKTKAPSPPNKPTDTGPNGKKICNTEFHRTKGYCKQWIARLVTKQHLRVEPILSELIIGITWRKLVRTRIVSAEDRIGPRYPNSLPFFEAQKAYAVKETTTPAVNTKASRTIFPAISKWLLNNNYKKHIQETNQAVWRKETDLEC